MIFMRADASEKREERSPPVHVVCDGAMALGVVAPLNHPSDSLTGLWGGARTCKGRLFATYITILCWVLVSVHSL